VDGAGLRENAVALPIKRGEREPTAHAHSACDVVA
jgi:hypothetical protein